MKKIIISTFLIIVSSSMFAAAQLNVGGTIGGVPVSVSTGNGGVINIGSGAQGMMGAGGSPILRLLGLAQTVVSRLVPFMIGVAVIAFFWFLIQYIWKGDESAGKRQEGLKGMGYSLLALFVMVSVWGIIAVMSSILGVGVGGGLPPLEMPAMK
ncbi:hypothetical protein K9M47_00185 [Candidatus Gracilibacteria bacterium]|nr:hypothetical protein [Candidatus Gracilibacteria bacterium]MCF7898395.1 hypothetical protein [Candidatus Paceibacterota bacterium]